MEDKISAGEEVENLSNQLGSYDGTVVMEKRPRVEWSGLPKELWIEIAKHLNTTMDIIRFRSFQFPFKHPNPLFPYITWPRVLDLIDFHVVELIEAYTLSSYKYDEVGDDDVFTAVPQFRRVVLVPSVSIEGAFGLILFKNGKLAVFNIRDESVHWMSIYAGNNYDGIILHEGQVYIVVKQGNIFRFDVSSLNLVYYSNLTYNYGNNFYKEGKEERWLRVNNLGDVSFVLGEDNFSVTAKDYYGFEGNCIYFYDPARLNFNSGAPRLCCFNLEKGMCAQ
ncbi:uncharacterized protein LOC130737192 [Lotus japonicus]|uniref:uncharacterized protein LOC130737192 n=1 Tax=Lotus japonicus TaxID=34305 RepID=UPI0025867D83|nr:uncharacterized protein LOC130737192 [Lotus japonicus]